ncbi:MAG: metallopeptidase TldD-related protein [Actinomycetes bacterium]
MNQHPSSLVEQALACAHEGAELIAIADLEQRGNLRWAQNSLTTNGLTRALSLTLIALVQDTDGTKTAAQTFTNIDTEDLQSMVNLLIDRAKHGDVSTVDSGVALASDHVDATFADLAPVMDPAVFTPLIQPLAQALNRARAEDLTWSGYAEANTDSTWVGVSSGARRVFHQNAASIEITQRATRTDGVLVSSWAGASANTFAELSIPDLEHTVRQAREWSELDIEVEPGHYDVILTAAAVADLAIPALWEASARDAVEGSSAFAQPGGGTKLGQPVMSPKISIRSDPGHPEVSTAPFVVEHSSGPTSSVADNAQPLVATQWIDSGVLRHLIGPRSYQTTVEQTRPTIDNIIIDSQGSGTLADLISRTENGLLITCLWYIRDVDRQTMLLTGLTRDGVYVVKDGKVVGAASNFRFNVSPLDVLSNIVDSTDSSRTQPREWGEYAQRVIAPAVMSTGFNLSTRSDAR